MKFEKSLSALFLAFLFAAPAMAADVQLKWGAGLASLPECRGTLSMSRAAGSGNIIVNVVSSEFCSKLDLDGQVFRLEGRHPFFHGAIEIPNSAGRQSLRLTVHSNNLLGLHSDTVELVLPAIQHEFWEKCLDSARAVLHQSNIRGIKFERISGHHNYVYSGISRDNGSKYEISLNPQSCRPESNPQRVSSLAPANPLVQPAASDVKAVESSEESTTAL